MPPKASKSRAGYGYQERQVGTREPKKRFLIVCEGKKTEPNYFHAFRVAKQIVDDVDLEGKGFDPKSLVEEADRIKNQQHRAVYDQIWCVFDRDDFDPEVFNAAIEMARSRGYRVAYSNEAFELWYLLHFEYLKSGISRVEYGKKLSNCLGRKYEKNSQEMYEILLDKQSGAIKRAKTLLDSYPSFSPINNNPSTTVHELVLELNQASANNAPRGKSGRSSS